MPLFAFLSGILLSACFILPYIFQGGGVFATIGDYFAQQIPFHVLCNGAIKNGNLLWDWYTDLGGSFLGNYSFYTLGSPFFWLGLLFPARLMPYVMPFLLMLKYGAASFSAYLYLQLFTEKKELALLGGWLYAFSGFQSTNLLFNHFHDAVAFFPLMLYGLECILAGKKKRWFLLFVGLNASVNFFFFVGEAVFCVLYFLFRVCRSCSLREGLRLLGRCLFEGAVGVGLAAVILIPSLIFTLGNPKTNADIPLFSTYLREDYIELLKALFLPNEAMNVGASGRPQNFSSMSLYLPMVGSLPALLYCARQRTKKLCHFILLCFVMACFPFLNSLFVAASSDAYFRWFYMLILMLALATVRLLDRPSKAGYGKYAVAYLVSFAVFVAFLVFGSGSGPTGNLILTWKYFLLQVLISLAGFSLTLFLLQRKAAGKRYVAGFLAGAAVFSVMTGFLTVYRMKSHDSMVAGQVAGEFNAAAQVIKMPEGEDYRIITSDQANEGMYFPVPSILCWNSTICGSVFRYYELIGAPRNTYAAVKGDNLPVMLLLSAKYDLTLAEEAGKTPLAGYDGDYVHMRLYEREMFLPFGFGYTHYLTESELRAYPPEERQRLMLRAVVVRDEDAEKVASYLSPLPEAEQSGLSDAALYRDYQERKAEASSSFTRTTDSFHSVLTSERGGMAFFSVPYDKGWHATVNGQPVEVVYTGGFMSVPLTAGENEIVFRYSPTELWIGAGVTGVSWLIFLAVLILDRRRTRRTIRPGCKADFA